MKFHGSSRLFYFVSLFYRRLVTGQASCSVVSPTAFMAPRCAFPLGLLMCDVVEIEQLVRHFQPVCPAAVRNCGIPHCRQHLRRLIDPVILNDTKV